MLDIALNEVLFVGNEFVVDGHGFSVGTRPERPDPFTARLVESMRGVPVRPVIRPAHIWTRRTPDRTKIAD